ncbi:MAG: GNAT family N-acetyltransferase [Caldilineaceae bacterium]|nr:GNAT family N-acetyltransferase [Caldilineaceae bacterium]
MSKSVLEQIQIVNIRPEHGKGLAQLQRDCFPTLGEQELMKEEHFLSHCRIFPEGDFVVLLADHIIGLGSGFFVDFDFDQPDHSFLEMIDGGYYTRHDPNGLYYYAGDISVHPDFRGQGIGRRLYDARKDLVRRYRKRGIIGGGLLPGYVHYKGKLTVAEYVDAVVSGKLTDPTLTFQLRNGFKVMGMIENYIEDSASDNWATLIFWENGDW